MLTLTDINRALDRLGVAAFIPRTRRQPVVLAAAPRVHDDPEPPVPRVLAVVVLLRPRHPRDDGPPAPSAVVG